jgi:glycogen(starch) synthase
MVNMHHGWCFFYPLNIPMHIAFATPELLKGDNLYPGGLSTYTFNTAKALKERGHFVTIFLSGTIDREFDFKGLRVVERKPRVPWIFKPMDKLLSRWLSEGLGRCWSSLTINKTIGAYILRERIDLIHYTNWKAIGLFSVNHPALLRISSYDSLWDNNPDNRHLGKKFVHWLEKKSIKRFEHIIGPGDHLARYIENDLKLSHPIRLVPTPVEIKRRENSGNASLVSARKRVLYAGTVSQIKGAELLFELITKFLKCNDDTEFVVAGKAGVVRGKSCRGTLESLAESFPNSFTYHPHLDRSLLEIEYATADLVIIPSLIDNFPNTALEAMSNGTMVLASDTASLGTLLKDGQNGFVMQGRNVDDWIGRMRHILFEMDDERKNDMRKAMSDSLEAFDTENAIGKLLSEYEKLLSAR